MWFQEDKKICGSLTRDVAIICVGLLEEGVKVVEALEAEEGDEADKL